MPQNGRTHRAQADRRDEPVTLASRRDLAPRIQRILASVLDLVRDPLRTQLPQVFDELERDLFRFAERAGSNEEQSRCFEALAGVKSRRGEAVARFLANVESGLARFDRPVDPRDAVADASGAPARQRLELVDSRAFEEELSLRQLSTRSDVRCGPILLALGYRFGVLAGLPPFETEQLPLGPAQLSAALRQAIAALDIELTYRMLAYGLFDRTVMRQAADLYEAVDGALRTHGVLPNLQLGLALPKTAAAKPAATGADAEAAAAAEAGAAPAPKPAEAPAPEATPDNELFATLRNLLGQAHGRGRRPSQSGTERKVDIHRLQSTLASLQQHQPSATRLPGARHVRSSEELRRELIEELHRTMPGKGIPELSAEDSDTVDLVGMMFDFVGNRVRGSDVGQNLLGEMQWPVLRVALADKDFFARPDHPARRLLNTVVETSRRWLDEEADPELAATLQQIVHHVASDRADAAVLIEPLLADLAQQITMLTRRAHASERRLVEAARGREKLDHARQRAASMIDGLLARKPAPPLLHSLLTQAWSDVLALSILRQGEDSASHRRRLAVADQLLNPANLTGASARTLRSEVEEGLAQVGLHGDDAKAITREIFEPKPAEAAEAAAGEPPPEPPQQLTEVLQARPRLGGDAPEAPAKGKAEPIHVPLTDEEKRLLERLRKIAFGTWFEFDPKEGVAPLRRKLAWYSTLTGRCLFVSQRGTRAEDMTLEQVAREIARGRIRVMAGEHESMVDRAWKAITHSLRKLSGTPEVAPA
jgi:hypothetical protein